MTTKLRALKNSLAKIPKNKRDALVFDINFEAGFCAKKGTKSPSSKTCLVRDPEDDDYIGSFYTVSCRRGLAALQEHWEMALNKATEDPEWNVADVIMIMEDHGYKFSSTNTEILEF